MITTQKSVKRKFSSIFGVLLAWVFLMSSVGYAQPTSMQRNVQTATNMQTSVPAAIADAQASIDTSTEKCIEKAKTDNCCPGDQPPPCSGDDNCADPCVSAGLTSAVLSEPTGLTAAPRTHIARSKPTANSGLSPYTISPPPRN